MGLFTPSAIADTVNFMKDINKKRRDAYKVIAQKKGQLFRPWEA
ncbi:MAG: hypothetical protein KC592_13185 [Nitrospira sp.]|nr:hypothetical protein [Nitrospira sp.]HBP87816.1 hypothetical protein [Nitrospiraceae bacterium]